MDPGCQLQEGPPRRQQDAQALEVFSLYLAFVRTPNLINLGPLALIQRCLELPYLLAPSRSPST